MLTVLIFLYQPTHCATIIIMNTLKIKQFLSALVALTVLVLCLLIIGYIFKPQYHLPARTPTDISKSGAQSIVEKISEVKDYESLLEKNNKKASFIVEDGGDFWRVQVLEVVNNNGLPHTATFGWYTVNKKTGMAEKDL